MDESLLGAAHARAEVDEEELWNALHEPMIAPPQPHAPPPPPPSHHPPPLSSVSVPSSAAQRLHPHHQQQRRPPQAAISAAVPSTSGPYYGRDPTAEAEPFLSPPPASGAAPPSRPLPSLRNDVHLPAISTLFQNVLDSAKSALGTGASTAGTGSGSGGSGDRTPGHPVSVGRVSCAPDEHGRVANVDAFLINLYNFFYHKGLWSIVVVEVVGLTTGLFTVALSSFAVGCIEWSKLLECHQDKTSGCHQQLEKYMTCDADEKGLRHLVVAFYFTMFLVYWGSRVVRLVGTIRDAQDMSQFYTRRLNIDERLLQTISWDEIVNRVLGLVGSVNVPQHLKHISSYRLQIDPILLSSPHDFARRIMRRENYLIAFMNNSLFQDSKFLPPVLQFASTSHVMFSRNIEVNLNVCLIDQMFDGDQNLSLASLNDVQALQKRFMVAGVFNFVLMPFILMYRCFHVLFQSSQQWYTNRVVYFGSRRWSSYARWKFREYNELPHALEARMNRSHSLADKYLSMFPAGLTAVIAGGITFCANSLMVILFAISLIDESILLETTYRNHQLVFYLSIAGLVSVIGRSFSVSETSPFMLNGDAEEAMLQLSAETHYFPKEWRGQCSTYEVRDAFLSLYPFKFVIFAQECLSVIMAPYILCVSLPQSAREMLLFIRSHSLAIPNVGAVCRFAEFDFKRYANDPKMEASFISFKQNHPTWVGAEEGEVLMQRLGRVKEEELEKSMRLGDTMLYSSQPLSMSQQLMQSQAIHTALGGRFGGMMGQAPQENEFYWFEKMHKRGQLDDSLVTDSRESKQEDLSLSSVRV